MGLGASSFVKVKRNVACIGVEHVHHGFELSSNVIELHGERINLVPQSFEHACVVEVVAVVMVVVMIVIVIIVVVVRIVIVVVMVIVMMTVSVPVAPHVVVVVMIVDEVV